MIEVRVREIHEIELTSICNLACTYCPHPNLGRAKAHMEWSTFERTLEHIAYLCEKGTQGEVSLTGIGEAILYPRFIEALYRVREVIGDRKLITSTNGVAMTEEIARALADTGTGVYVSLHRLEVAAPALEMLKAAGCATATNVAFVDSALDWAGQVDWYVSAPKAAMCGYLSNSWAVVRQCGSVDACCMDAHSLYPVGSVFDEPGSLHTHVTDLCAKCNFRVPEVLLEAA